MEENISSVLMHTHSRGGEGILFRACEEERDREEMSAKGEEERERERERGGECKR